MPDEFDDAPEVKAIADELIATYPTTYSELVNIEIRYVFVAEAPVKRGKVVLGQAKKITGLQAHLAGAERPASGLFVVQISRDVWHELDGPQREALVDHELMHLDVDYDDDTGEPKLSIRAHDIEEFTAIVSRHGSWRPEITRFGDALQLSLLDGLAPARG